MLLHRMSIELRILTLNTHKGFSTFNARFVIDELREAIRQVSAELVFLQEVIGENEIQSQIHHNWPDQSHYEFLADEIWTDFAYGKNAVYPYGHHGNALLSKYPILASQQIDVSTNRFEQRGFLYCTIDSPTSGETLHCVCVHLGLSAVSRAKQLDLIASYIEENVPDCAPLIVAGDFNDWSGRRGRVFAERLGLKEAFQQVHGKCAKSFPSFYPILRLDRIYLRGLCATMSRVHACNVWSQLSDHAALYTEVHSRQSEHTDTVEES